LSRVPFSISLGDFSFRLTKVFLFFFCETTIMNIFILHISVHDYEAPAGLSPCSILFLPLYLVHDLNDSCVYVTQWLPFLSTYPLSCCILLFLFFIVLIFRCHGFDYRSMLLFLSYIQVDVCSAMDNLLIYTTNNDKKQMSI
jgi:hypothetical protein